MFGFFTIKLAGGGGGGGPVCLTTSLVPRFLCWGFSGGHFVPALFGVYGKFYFHEHSAVLLG